MLLLIDNYARLTNRFARHLDEPGTVSEHKQAMLKTFIEKASVPA